MGKYSKKTPHQKQLHAEKNKTQLKQHKTILPSGTNITKTAFKVKKIVVKKQLREHIGEIVSKNNLNVKELLTRLHHHNAPLRIHALTGLYDVVETHGNKVLKDYLPALLQASSNLVLDKEKDVRAAAIKLLTIILIKSTECQLSELFDVIVKHLACAMSHIDANIRSDSLLLLDVLIDKKPKLTAKFCQPVILPAFLDLISTKFADSDRKLIVKYTNTMTTNIWRIKVLNRLQALLLSIVNVKKEECVVLEEQENVRRIVYSDTKPIYASLHTCSYDRSKNLDLVKMQTEKSKVHIDQNDEIQNYSAILIPLLMDIFVEVAPQKNKTQRTAHLSNEAAVLLKYITDIMLLLWQIFGFSDSPSELKHWFWAQFNKPITEHMIVNRFPFALMENESKSLQQKHPKNIVIPGFSREQIKFLHDSRCTHLNVAVSEIYLNMHSNRKSDINKYRHISSYVINLLPRCFELERETVVELLNCVDCLFSVDIDKNARIDMNNLIGVVKKLYETSRGDKKIAHHHLITEKVFSYLFKMVLVDTKNGVVKNSDLRSWLESLPSLLTMRKIQFYVIKSISHIARCNLQPFLESLDGYIETILHNLPHMKIISERGTDSIEGKKLIANLLYFVKTWDEEFVKGLKRGVDNGYFSHLNNHIKDIMECRSYRSF